MNAQENIQIAQETYRLFSQGDINGIMNYYPDDIEFVFPGPSNLVPLSGTFRGKEQVGQFFALVNEHLQFDQFEPQEFIAQGDKVVILGRDKGSVRSTGKTFDEEWVHVATMRDGKVSRWQAFVDTYKIAADFSPVTTPKETPLEV